MHLKALIYFCKSVPSKIFGRVLNIFLTFFESKFLVSNSTCGAAQKKKFSIKDFFNKFDQMRRLLRIWSHLLKKSLMENFIFCAVWFVALLQKWGHVTWDLYAFIMFYHCMKSVRIWSYSGPYFSAFGLNTERHTFTPNAGKCGPE